MIAVSAIVAGGNGWLACAFARQAARLDHSVLYLRVPRLFENLSMARLDGRVTSTRLPKTTAPTVRDLAKLMSHN